MKRIVGIFVIALIIIGIVITGCTKTPSPTAKTPSATATSSPAVNAPATIKVGAMLSITGADSATGLPTQWTFQYAIDEINKNGGVFVKAYNKKIPLELDLKDNQTDPEKTMAAAEQLNADGCPVVIGTTLAGISANILKRTSCPCSSPSAISLLSPNKVLNTILILPR